MRLTEKIKMIPIRELFENQEEYEKQLQISKEHNKLVDLENIEERFGIDLITLFKALENGVYVKHLKEDWRTKYLHKKEDCIEFLPLVKIAAIGMFYAYNGGDTFSANYFTKDYGKTWALTEEELENK